jgi:hypothetical protein
MANQQKPHDLEPGTRIGDATAGPGGGPSRADPQRSPGQRVSQERGTATRNKKNPGKRPHQGGGAR